MRDHIRKYRVIPSEESVSGGVEPIALFDEQGAPLSLGGGEVTEVLLAGTDFDLNLGWEPHSNPLRLYKQCGRVWCTGALVAGAQADYVTPIFVVPPSHAAWEFGAGGVSISSPPLLFGFADFYEQDGDFALWAIEAFPTGGPDEVDPGTVMSFEGIGWPLA